MFVKPRIQSVAQKLLFLFTCKLKWMFFFTTKKLQLCALKVLFWDFFSKLSLQQISVFFWDLFIPVKFIGIFNITAWIMLRGIVYFLSSICFQFRHWNTSFICWNYSTVFYMFNFQYLTNKTMFKPGLRATFDTNMCSLLWQIKIIKAATHFFKKTKNKKTFDVAVS